MPPVGLEPTTFGLKGAHFLGFCRRREQLRPPKRSSRRSELLNSGHVRDTLSAGLLLATGEQLFCPGAGPRPLPRPRPAALQPS